MRLVQFRFSLGISIVASFLIRKPQILRDLGLVEPHFLRHNKCYQILMHIEDVS